MTTHHRHAIKDIVAMLNARAEELARELVPDLRREGPHLRCDTIHGGAGQAFCITVSGAKAGMVKDFRSGIGYDLLGLIGAVKFGDPRQVSEALRFALEWLGLERAGAPSVPPAELERQKLAAREAQAARAETEAREQAARSASAWKRWQALKIERPTIAGTPVEQYLLGRAIDLRRLGRAPGALVYDPACHCEEIDAPLPAMVALVSDAQGAPLGVHRTWLEIRANGGVEKAALDHPKKSLGSIRSGMIKLWRGASGRPLQDCPRGSTVMVAEGIEDALSAACALPLNYAVAGISAANLASISFPANVAEIVLLDQNDDRPDTPGLTAKRAQAMRALEAAKKTAIANWQHQAKRVRRLALPREIGGRKIKDANDLVRALRQPAAMEAGAA